MLKIYIFKFPLISLFKIYADNNELSVSSDFITSSYRLQDITDVHIMARLQEASKFSGSDALTEVAHLLKAEL